MPAFTHGFINQTVVITLRVSFSRHLCWN